MFEEQEDKNDSFSEDVTVEELFSSVMKSKSLLSGRLKRNRSLMSTNNNTESTQRFIKEERCIDEEPQLQGSILAMQKTDSPQDPLPIFVTPKMGRSISTPEITRTKPFINKNVDFNMLSCRFKNNKKLEEEKCTQDLAGRPFQQESLLFSLKNTSNSVTKDCGRSIYKNHDFNRKSNLLVNIHKSYNAGSHHIKSNFSSLHLNNAENNSNKIKNPSLKGTSHYNCENTGNSTQSTLSIEEMLKNCTINKNYKSCDGAAHLPHQEKQGNTIISSFNIPIVASPKQSIQFSNSDMITVNGKSFLKLRQIGKGGSSIVYEVLDLITRHCRAIKFVDLKDEDESVKESYKNEIKILQKLQKYSRIIKVFDHEDSDTELKIVMEAGGNDLAAILGEARQKKIAIPSYSVKHYFRDMLLAVQQIHSEGIIHSDLKPANFLLVDGILKLIDFGIASSIQHDMTSVFKDTQSGTFNYMSPESLSDVHSGPIINGRVKDKPTIKIGVKSDIWSLGCILYNLAYGYTPFQHLSNPLHKLAAISNPNTKISFAPLGDKNLLDVLQRTLNFNPRDRPSIDDLLKHPYLSDDLGL